MLRSFALLPREAAEATGHVITVEDHYAEGGVGEAVRSVLADSPATVRSLAVRKRPRSGTPRELLDQQSISARAVVAEVPRAVRGPYAASGARGPE